jgi:hypothetical protein
MVVRTSPELCLEAEVPLYRAPVSTLLPQGIRLESVMK